jgi:hypothetical protein
LFFVRDFLVIRGAKPQLFPRLNHNGMSFRIPRNRDEESQIKETELMDIYNWIQYA